MVPRNYPVDSSKDYVFADHWRDLPLPYHLYSRAYSVTMKKEVNNQLVAESLPLFRKTILFRVSAPQLTAGQSLAIVGSHPALGSWNPTRFLPMQPIGDSDWMFTLNVDWIGLPLEYKYVVVDENQQLVMWEEGDNRQISELPNEGQVLVLCGQPLRVQEKTWRVAGVCVPVFALRSEHSFGVGDFGDLRLFVDWAASVGMKVIQLLPVNDTTVSHQWDDSYPYNIVSAFALHPHYLDVAPFGTIGTKQQATSLRRQQRELNALNYSDYEAVERVKMSYVRNLFESPTGQETLSAQDFKDWCDANKHWLDPYTEWKIQCDHIEGEEEERRERFFVAFVQYHLHLQLKETADHARSLGVCLKGDLPIGVAALSAETWQHPAFFHLGAQTGAPPDAFSLQGQNWGFPTYNWNENRDAQPTASIYDWFALRLRALEQYFDALRIDHVLGFFRIWEIPASQKFGTMGHFSPALPLTKGDIEYYGLVFRKDFFTKPFVSDQVVERLFGIHADYVREHYLVKKPYGLYDLKEEVATQRQVEACFEGRHDENSLWIRDGLYQLVANVLFLEDERQPEMYHPRIRAYNEPVFKTLSMEERDAYMRLYNNYFFQRHNIFWGKQGYDRLSRLFTNTQMLICAEDLGMMPDCVQPVLDALRILTLEIQQMPKESGTEFTHLDGNPTRSVATISTHDMPPLRLWWEENSERAQRFYTNMLQKEGKAPQHLPAHLAEEIIARHLYSPSMLCILSLQDWLAMDSELRAKNPRDERINVPSDPYNRWQWRMHIGIEKLKEAAQFNEKVRTMITRSKR
jgi:4-alpha-glucanotransferase